jgi:hypothetical protein
MANNLYRRIVSSPSLFHLWPEQETSRLSFWQRPFCLQSHASRRINRKPASNRIQTNQTAASEPPL